MTGPDRRLSVWGLSTVVVLVLLFRYPTSTGGSSARAVAVALAPVGVVAEPPAPQPAQRPSVAAAPPRPGRTAAPAPVVRRTTAAAPLPTHRAALAATHAPAPAPRKAAAPQPTRPTTRTVNGAAVDTRYGPVQVQIRVSGTRIVASDAIVYPTESSRNRQINERAVPQLNDETLQAQSAGIDTVSGATYTSDGYRQSLQSALDAAHR